jgi:hypothetical protein
MLLIWWINNTALGANLALEIKKQLGQSDMAELQKYASLAMRRDQQRLTTNPTFDADANLHLPPMRGPAPAELSGITLSGTYQIQSNSIKLCFRKYFSPKGGSRSKARPQPDAYGEATPSLAVRASSQ